MVLIIELLRVGIHSKDVHLLVALNLSTGILLPYNFSRIVPSTRLGVNLPKDAGYFCEFSMR